MKCFLVDWLVLLHHRMTPQFRRVLYLFPLRQLPSFERNKVRRISGSNRMTFSIWCNERFTIFQRHCHNLIYRDFQLRNQEKEVWFDKAIETDYLCRSNWKKGLPNWKGVNTDISWREGFSEYNDIWWWMSE